MGKEIPTSRFSGKDFTAFKRRLRDETSLLDEWLQHGRFAEEPLRGGFELEAWLVDRHCLPAPLNKRFLELCDNTLVVPELAKFNIELNGSPQSLQGGALHAMHTELRETWRKCHEVAKALDIELLMIGILPTAREQELSLANMSHMERFRALNEQIFNLRKGRPLQFNIQGRQTLRTTHRNVMLEAAATSFQIHLQVAAKNAVRFYNAARIISAPMVAATANSPYLFAKDLWDETRIPLFEQAIALGGYERPPCGEMQRVSFGSGFVEHSLGECFHENLDCYPILLPVSLDQDPEHLAHVRLHNGTIWRWNRPLIGYNSKGTPHLRIEHRVVPAGPTVIDAIANAAFFFGLIYALSEQSCPPETQISFAQARANFYAAAKYGLRARMTWLGGNKVAMQPLLLEDLLPRARRGLDGLGIERKDADRYLGIIEARVESARNGAGWQRAYVARHDCDMQTMATAYLGHQHEGTPVHEWPL